jgi:fatty acid synthase subunit alpha
LATDAHHCRPPNASDSTFIPVSAQADQWIAAEVFRNEFLYSEKLIDRIESTNEPDLSEATVELCARFIAYISQQIHDDTGPTSARTELLLSVFKYFTSSYLSVKDVHTLVAAYDIEVRKTVLFSYFQALALLHH